METHSQELHKIPGHGWKHYMFEFFMLFLAVTLGFYADNVRENIKRHEEVKNNMKAMVADLRTDVQEFSSGIESNGLECRNIDTLINLLHGDRSNTSEIYYLARVVTAQDFEFYISGGTFEQMKSSGTLKLIMPQDLVDSISDYYTSYRENIEAQNRLELQGIVDVKSGNADVFDGLIFQQMFDTARKKSMITNIFKFTKPLGNPPLITNDLSKINRAMIYYHYYEVASSYNAIFAKDQRQLALQIIAMIEKQYNLN